MKKEKKCPLCSAIMFHLNPWTTCIECHWHMRKQAEWDELEAEYADK